MIISPHTLMDSYETKKYLQNEFGIKFEGTHDLCCQKNCPRWNLYLQVIPFIFIFIFKLAMNNFFINKS